MAAEEVKTAAWGWRWRMDGGGVGRGGSEYCCCRHGCHGRRRRGVCRLTFAAAFLSQDTMDGCALGACARARHRRYRLGARARSVNTVPENLP